MFELLCPSLQVLLMVGLPGSGKSHWARTHMKQHPEKQYRLLGTEELLACMIVSQTSSLHSQALYYMYINMFKDGVHFLTYWSINVQPLCVRACLEWGSEGKQAAAGLSVSDWCDQDSCSDSWQLYPRPGNSSHIDLTLKILSFN